MKKFLFLFFICVTLLSSSMMGWDKKPIPDCSNPTSIISIKNNVYILGYGGYIAQSSDNKTWNLLKTDDSINFMCGISVGDSLAFVIGYDAMYNSHIYKIENNNVVQMNEIQGFVAASNIIWGDTIYYSGSQISVTGNTPALMSYDLANNTVALEATIPSASNDMLYSYAKSSYGEFATSSLGNVYQKDGQTFKIIFQSDTIYKVNFIDDSTGFLYGSNSSLMNYDFKTGQWIKVNNFDADYRFVNIYRLDKSEVLLIAKNMETNEGVLLYSRNNGNNFTILSKFDEVIGSLTVHDSEVCVLAKNFVFVGKLNDFQGVETKKYDNEINYVFNQEQLSLPNLTDIAQYSISDIEGIQVSAGTLLPGGSIDLSGLPANTMYFVSLHIASHSVINFKVLNNYISVYNSK